jgi:hypothetical protein
MSRILYPSEANKLHMLGSNDIYNRAFGMWLSPGIMCDFELTCSNLGILWK